MRQEGLSRDVSYDVYVKLGVDHMGRPAFSDAVAHFREHQNAVTYKRQLEARGETVHVQKGTVYGFSDRKSTRLNSSHANISYAVFCLKKKLRVVIKLSQDRASLLVLFLI